ncbi:MAG TPA: nucleotidyltransferase family protein [Terriglobales bacterium]
MGRAPSLCGVILAAGDSTRMGQDKALLPWPPRQGPARATGETFLSAAIRRLGPAVDLVIVVAGVNEPALEPVAYATSAFLVRNPEPGRGQFSSLQVGLQEVLNRGRDAAMVTLVDRPPVLEETIEQLRTAFADALDHGKWAVVPEFQGKHGHPIMIGRELIEVFLKAPHSSSARQIEHQHQARIEYLPVTDPAVAANVNTPEEYAALLSARQS